MTAKNHWNFNDSEKVIYKVAAKLKETKKLVEEPENQEEEKTGATEKQDSM